MATNSWSDSSSNINGSIKREFTKSATLPGPTLDSYDVGFYADDNIANRIIEYYSTGTSNSIGMQLYISASGNYTESPIDTDMFFDLTRWQTDSNAFLTGSGRRVWVIHDVHKHEYNQVLRVGILGYNVTGNGTFKYGRSNSGQIDDWNSYEDYDGIKYYVYTGEAGSIWKYTTFTAAAKTEYQFKLHTISEAQYDGIVISSNTLTNNNISSFTVGSGGVIAKCSGVDVSETYTYTNTSSSSTTIYIYYRTNNSTFGGSATQITYDSHNNTEKGTHGFTTGEVKVEVLNEPVIVTLNDNGGSGGSGTKTVNSGTVSGNIGSVNVPTRGSNPAFTFGGYYNRVAYSGGNQYISSSGSGTGGYSITSAITLYARWSNTISYEPASSLSLTYSTSQQSRTIASTATCASGGTVTYSISSVRKNGTIITNPGFSITLASNGYTTNLIVPASLAVGTYTITIGLTSPNSGSASSSTYAAGSLSKTITVTISESTPQNDAWSNTTSSLIGGTYKRVYTNTQSSPGNIDSVVPGPSTTSEGTSIIELYHDPGTSSNSGVGVGLVGPTVTTSGLGSGVISGRTCFFDGIGVYDFMAQSVNVEPYVGQSTAVRKVYSVHNCDISTSNGVKAVYLGTKSGSTNSVGYYGYSTPAAFNVWASHVSGDSRRRYYAITVNTHKTYDYEEISVQSGKSYIFNMYTDSEALHDGILLTNAIISDPTSTINYTNLDTYKSNNSSTCLEVCHGNKVSKSYSYTPSSNQTLYLYYYTDNDTIKMGNANASACIGACEVIERVSMTITFNKVGGSSGTSTTTIYSQTPAADYPSITVPTRSGYTFLGYWDSSAANSGTQYVTSTGAGARVWDKTSNTNLYARWENNVSYTTTDKTVYCTSAAVVATSTTASQPVAISSAGCSATAGTCSATVQVCPAGQTWTVTSDGKTLTVPSGVSVGTYNITIRCTSTSGGTAGSNYYYKQTKDYTVTITVVATTISSYANPTVTCSGGELDAAGETVTLSPSFSQTVTWNNNATSTITTGGSYTYAVQTSSTGFSLINTNQVKVTNNTSTSTRGTFKVRVTCSINGKSGYADASFTQEAGAKVYEIPLISSFTYALYPASGATNSPVIEFTQHWTWNGVNDGTGGDVNSGGTKSFTASSLPTGCSKNSTTTFPLDGKIKWANRGTDTGAARNANGKINVTVTVNGQTSSSFSCTYCEQEANYLTWGNVSLTVSSPATPYAMNKAGETVAISASATQSASYTSGSTDSYTPVLSYAVKTSKTGYSLSSNSVTVTNNNSSTARNGFVVTVTATGITGTNSTYETGFNKTATSDRTFNQPAGSKVYGTPIVKTYTYTVTGATGATNKTPTVSYSLPYTWNGTGSTSYETTGGTIAYTSTGTFPDRLSVSTSFSTNGYITWGNNNTSSAKDGKSNLKVTVTKDGNTSTAYSCTSCYQSAGSITYASPTVTFTYTRAAKTGETISPTLTYTQSGNWNGVTSDSITPITTGATVTYTSTGTFPDRCSIATSTGAVTWGNNNTATAKQAKSNISVTVSNNGKSTTVSPTNCSQAAGSIVYASPSITTFTYSQFPAGGATQTPTVSYTQSGSWNSVAADAITPITTGATLAFTNNKAMATGFTKADNYATTGAVTAANRTTTSGAARNCTGTSILRVKATLNGVSSAYKYCTSCVQEANTVTLTMTFASNPIAVNATTAVTVDASYTSGSTESDVTASVTFSMNPTGKISIS